MKKVERFMISNQFKILEALYPNEAHKYAGFREVFEEGYEPHYEWAMQHLTGHIVGYELTTEVLQTLDLFRALKYFEVNNNLKIIDQDFLRFRGYSIHDPIQVQMNKYVCYIVSYYNRYPELEISVDEIKNSQLDTNIREKYQKMLKVWENFENGLGPGSQNNLFLEQVEQIIAA